MTSLAFVLGVLIVILPQDAVLERRAITALQQVPLSKLDSTMPERQFGGWFNQTVGLQAGVHWQLTDCYEQEANTADLPICVEVVALLPNERKAVIVALVGTLKQGVAGFPQIKFMVIEHKGEFYKIPRLRDLPDMLTKPLKPKPRPVTLPDLRPAGRRLIGTTRTAASAATAKLPSPKSDPPPPPPPVLSRIRSPRSVGLGEVIVKVSPDYPATARQVGAAGEVKVEILVSEAGRVLEAKAISGHALLRPSAESASRKWIFKPAELDGKPVRAQGILSFLFTRPQ